MGMRWWEKALIELVGARDTAADEADKNRLEDLRRGIQKEDSRS